MGEHILGGGHVEGHIMERHMVVMVGQIVECHIVVGHMVKDHIVEGHMEESRIAEKNR